MATKNGCCVRGARYGRQENQPGNQVVALQPARLLLRHQIYARDPAVAETLFGELHHRLPVSFPGGLHPHKGRRPSFAVFSPAKVADCRRMAEPCGDLHAGGVGIFDRRCTDFRELSRWDCRRSMGQHRRRWRRAHGRKRRF